MNNSILSKRSNISDIELTRTTTVFNNIIDYVYEKRPVKKINMREMTIRFPNCPTFKIILTKVPNMQKILSLILANIDKTPFTDKEPNIYAFEAIWLLLSILEEDQTRLKYLKMKDIFSNLTINTHIINVIRFGTYIITVPNYRKYIFNISGYGLATLSIT